MEITVQVNTASLWNRRGNNYELMAQVVTMNNEMPGLHNLMCSSELIFSCDMIVCNTSKNVLKNRHGAIS